MTGAGYLKLVSAYHLTATGLWLKIAELPGTIALSERFKSLSLFSSIYGIGPSTARRLYALGLRTLDDLEAYFGVEPEEEESRLVEIEHQEKFGRMGETGLGETWIKIALGLRKDLDIKFVLRTSL